MHRIFSFWQVLKSIPWATPNCTCPIWCRSAGIRVVINVDVEEQSTGDFSVMGGYSTADGFMGQVSVSERNLLRAELISPLVG
jgi:hypothetical protein